MVTKIKKIDFFNFYTRTFNPKKSFLKCFVKQNRSVYCKNTNESMGDVSDNKPNKITVEIVENKYQMENQNIKSLSGENITVIKSPTGSGKTYSVLEQAIENAIENKISVISFPNSNLLNENLKNLKNMILERTEYKNANVNVQEVTLSDQQAVESQDLLQKLMRGRIVIVTLHTYFTQRGDYFFYSKFFQMLQPFKPITTLFIDEGHMFFETFKKNYPITSLVEVVNQKVKTITNTDDLEKSLVEKRKVYSSPTVLNSKTKGVGKNIIGIYLQDLIDVNPQNQVQIFDKSFDSLHQQLPIFDNKAYQSVFTFSPKFEPIKNEVFISGDNVENAKNFLKGLEDQNQVPIKFGDVNNLNSSTPFASLTKLSINKEDSNNSYEGRFYSVYPITLTGDVEKDKILKNYLTNIFIKIFDYNSYRTSMLALDASGFNNDLRKVVGTNAAPIKPTKVKAFEFVTKYNNLFIQKMESLFSGFQSQDEQDKQQIILKLVLENLNKIATNYVYVLLNFEFNQRSDLVPTTEVEALSLQLILSQNHYVLSFYPNSNKTGTILNFNEYTNKVLEINAAKDKQSQEGQEVQEGQEGQEVQEGQEGQVKKTYKKRANQTNLEEENQSEIENEASEFEDKNKNKEKLSYISEMPFTKNIWDLQACKSLSLFSVAELILMEGFNQVFFVSATYSSTVIDNLKTSLDNIGFYDIGFQQTKLNRLVIIRSGIDWFTLGAPKVDIRSLWLDFAKHFSGLFNSEPNQDETYYKQCLFLAATNSAANNFCNYKIPKDSNLFSQIVASSEQTMDVKITERRGFKILQGAFDKSVVRVSSIQSTVAAGLNMPQQTFIIAAANVFKPTSIIWRQVGLEIADARYTEALIALIQAVGRSARLSKYEKETNAYTSRLVLISSANTFPNIATALVQNSLNFYETVEIMDLEGFDRELSLNFRSFHLKNAYNEALEYVKEYANEYLNSLFPLGFGFKEAKEEIRFALLKDCLELNKNPNLKAEDILLKYKNFTKSYRFCASLCFVMLDLANYVLQYLEAKDNTSKNSIIGYAQNKRFTNKIFKDKLNYDRFQEVNQDPLKEGIAYVIELVHSKLSTIEGFEKYLKENQLNSENLYTKGQIFAILLKNHFIKYFIFNEPMGKNPI